MKLYYAPGVCSLASHIALTEADANFSLEKVDYKAKRTETGQDYLEINANGYVPALGLDSGDILTEGPAILQFIADTHRDAGLAPVNGTVERARVNGVLNFVGSELHKAFSPLFAATPPEGEAREAALANIAKRFDYVENLLADGRKFITGDDFTIADAYLFVVSNWSNFVNVDLTPWPNVVRFVERVAARPSVQKAMRAEGLIDDAA